MSPATASTGSVPPDGAVVVVVDELVVVLVVPDVSTTSCGALAPASPELTKASATGLNVAAAAAELDGVADATTTSDRAATNPASAPTRLLRGSPGPFVPLPAAASISLRAMSSRSSPAAPAAPGPTTCAGGRRLPRPAGIEALRSGRMRTRSAPRPGATDSTPAEARQPAVGLIAGFAGRRGRRVDALPRRDRKARRAEGAVSVQS